MVDVQQVEVERRPFAPKGDKAEWQVLYEALLETAEFGQVLTYAELDEALGRPFRDNRSPLYRANQELGDVRHRHLEPVPGTGYRVIEAVEHITAAQKRKRRARRQLAQMVRIGAVTDLTRLTPEQLTARDAQQRVNVALFGIITHHEQRLQRIEDILRREGLG